MYICKGRPVDDVKHIVSFSGGKDSTAMLVRMIEEGMPIDDIVFIKVMATATIGAELPEMYEYIERVEEYIHRKITVVPSILNFDEVFHQVFGSGLRRGQIYGYPFTIGAWCNNRLKIRTIEQHFKTYGEHIRYIGIAADEPERLIRLEPYCRAPLAEWGMTEKDCVSFLQERGLTNPLYQKFRRLGCWFCVKQGLDSLRVIRREYPEYWAMMLRWDLESPQPFKPEYTVHDLEERFAAEDCQLSIFDFNDFECMPIAA